ncbi:MAG: alpha-L-fucosidase, partial [Bacteroidales bacterium]|nr:alpha-L-fucosidase [Bacteroidales bacterium]
EGGIPDKQLDVPWETCMGMNGWGWRSEGEYKPLKHILASLVEVVAKGGNFLLGVGPNGEGVFDDKAVEMIKTIGQWMKKNGKAIYGTRTTPHYNDGNIWFTADKNGKRMYAIYALPEGQEQVPEIIEWTTHLPKGRKVTLVANGKKLKCQVDGNRVKVWLPADVDRTASMAMMFDAE